MSRSRWLQAMTLPSHRTSPDSSDDHTPIDREPVRWHMTRVLATSTGIGILSVAESFGMLLIGVAWMQSADMQAWIHMDDAHLQTMLFLQLVTAAHLLMFLTRTKKFFPIPPLPSWILFSAIMGTQLLAVLMAAFGWLMPPIPWSLVGLVLAYCVVWMFILDFAKLAMNRFVENRTAEQQQLLETINQPLNPQALG